MKFRVFISSVQSEFAEERRRLVEYIRQDALLGRFFAPFIFEKSGNGTESIISLCTEQGLKSPEYFADNVDFKTIVWRKQSISDGLQSGLQSGLLQSGLKSRPEIGQSHRPEIGQSQSLRQTVDTKILSALAQGESSRKQLSVVLGVSIQAGWFKKTLQRMLEDGLVEYSIPDKPQSRLQKYRLTEKAVVLMRRQKGT